MARPKLVLLLLFAAILSLEPALHQHSLIPGDGSSLASPQTVCVACAINAGGMIAATAALAAPAWIVLAFVAFAVAAPAYRPLLLVPGRAPPAR